MPKRAAEVSYIYKLPYFYCFAVVLNKYCDSHSSHERTGNLDYCVCILTKHCFAE